jgi:orotidine-5'-phosphate decarboxylase
MTMSYAERAAMCTNPTAKALFTIMHRKCSNLSAAVDVTSAAELLRLAHLLGPFICVLKVCT